MDGLCPALIVGRWSPLLSFLRLGNYRKIKRLGFVVVARILFFFFSEYSLHFLFSFINSSLRSCFTRSFLFFVCVEGDGVGRGIRMKLVIVKFVLICLSKAWETSNCCQISVKRLSNLRTWSCKEIKSSMERFKIYSTSSFAYLQNYTVGRWGRYSLRVVLQSKLMIIHLYIF